MFRGAPSKVILAHLPPRTIANLWRDHRREIASAGLGQTFDDFKAALRTLRQDPVCVSAGEVDPGRIGIAAPIFDGHGRVAGSLSIVLLSPRAGEKALTRLRANTLGAAREIERLQRRGRVRSGVGR
jgi:DNA-binding IclR family transcriptional regulator